MCIFGVLYFTWCCCIFATCTIYKKVNDADKFPYFLRVAVKPAPHIFEVKTGLNGEVIATSGFELKFLDLLAKDLNFSYQLYVPADKEWGGLTADGNWTGVVGMVSKGTVDLGIATLAITEQRSMAVEFSTPYSIQETTFAVEMAKILPKDYAFLKVFDQNVWLILIGYILVIPVVLKVILKRKYPLPGILFQIIGGLLKESVNFNLKHWSEYIVMYSWVLMSTVLLICYCSVLSAVLTIPMREQGVQNIDELKKEVNAGKYRCIVTRGTLAHNFFFNSQQETIKSIGDRIKENAANWVITSANKSKRELIEEGRTAIIAPRLVFELEFGGDVSITKFINQDPLITSYIGVAMRPGFCCKQELDTTILRINAAGKYNRNKEMELFKIRYRSQTNAEDHSPAFTLKDLERTLQFWAVGCFFGTIVLIIEILIHTLVKPKTYRKRRKIK